ncbi:MAG: hypothetical protein RLZZ600_946, partial [Actinomycetota bacterium]
MKFIRRAALVVSALGALAFALGLALMPIAAVADTGPTVVAP